MAKEEQGSLFQDNAEYEAFTEKFKPKKTTDDCYTPKIVYNTVRDWVCAEYKIEPGNIIRPFWPGGDYEAEEYPPGCCVVDNPPFSILAKIIAWYEAREIHYFLFAPALTLFSGANNGLNRCYLPTGADVVYENGATVKTSFVTNLDPLLIRSVPELKNAVEAASKKNQEAQKGAPRAKYDYPDEIVTAAMVQRWCHYGVPYELKREDAVFIRALDSQRKAGKAIFGGGFLLSARAAAERAAAKRWELSEREKRLAAGLPSIAASALALDDKPAEDPIAGQESMFPEVHPWQS